MARVNMGDHGLPGWQFWLEEVSNGHWRIEGHDTSGRSVGRDDGDEMEGLRACVEDAKSLSKELR